MKTNKVHPKEEPHGESFLNLGGIFSGFSNLFDKLDDLAQTAASGDHEMISNLAFLMPQTSADAFRHRIEHANARQTLPGFHFAVSGPWPPYSFCPALEYASG